ncbi:hypothetical protein T06_1682 [Trichinella sp. T6]|nr:hypothetical protein T06_1682 [Trichinella sp. T6]
MADIHKNDANITKRTISSICPYIQITNEITICSVRTSLIVFRDVTLKKDRWHGMLFLGIQI